MLVDLAGLPEAVQSQVATAARLTGIAAYSFVMAAMAVQMALSGPVEVGVREALGIMVALGDTINPTAEAALAAQVALVELAAQVAMMTPLIRWVVRVAAVTAVALMA